jgi:hypothetical protein
MQAPQASAKYRPEKFMAAFEAAIQVYNLARDRTETGAHFS